MNDLQKELNELKQFVADLKTDRAATKEKELREAWTKYVSLTVVIIAVFAAIASQWAGKFSSRTLISQAKASDQWSYYQAKSIKQNLYEVSRNHLPPGGNTNDPAFLKQEKEFQERVARYEKEKADIKAKAESLEQARDTASDLGGRMGRTISFFSVSIAMASICMVTKKKPLWFISMLFAAIALAEMVLIWRG